VKTLKLILLLVSTMSVTAKIGPIDEDAPTEYWLAIAHANGIRVPVNKSLAAAYFQQAAILGHAPSQRNLGIMLGMGDGILKNKIEAYAWLKIASVNKDEVAREAILDLITNMTDLEIKKGLDRAVDILRKLTKS
jgi:TPR repeat protein